MDLHSGVNVRQKLLTVGMLRSCPSVGTVLVTASIIVNALSGIYCSNAFQDPPALRRLPQKSLLCMVLWPELLMLDVACE